MGELPHLVRKEIPSKWFAIIGIALLIIGGLAFLNSLGSGGGYVATALIVSGIVLVIGAAVRGAIRAARRH